MRLGFWVSFLCAACVNTVKPTPTPQEPPRQSDAIATIASYLVVDASSIVIDSFGDAYFGTAVLYKGTSGRYSFGVQCPLENGICEVLDVKPPFLPAKKEAALALERETGVPINFAALSAPKISGKTVEYEASALGERWRARCDIPTASCNVVVPPAIAFLPMAAKELARKSNISEEDAKRAMTPKSRASDMSSIVYSASLDSFLWLVECSAAELSCKAPYPTGFAGPIADGIGWKITRTGGLYSITWTLTQIVSMESLIADFVWEAWVSTGETPDENTTVALRITSRSPWKKKCKEVAFYTTKQILTDSAPEDVSGMTLNSAVLLKAPLKAFVPLASSDSLSGVACGSRFALSPDQVKGLRRWMLELGITLSESPEPVVVMVESVKAPSKVKPAALWSGSIEPILKPVETKPTESDWSPPSYGKQCSKGCPCGNSCIDCSKTCRK